MNSLNDLLHINQDKINLKEDADEKMQDQINLIDETNDEINQIIGQSCKLDNAKMYKEKISLSDYILYENRNEYVNK